MNQSESKEADRRTEILNAAQKCFARHGFAKTTLDDIAKSVGMKAGSLYHYYNCKEAIFRDVIDNEGKEMLDWIRCQIDSEKTASKKILRYLKARLEYFQNATNLLDVSIQVVVEVVPLVDKLYQNYLNQEINSITVIIEDGIRAGDFKQCNGRRIAKSILTIAESIKYKAFQRANIMSESGVDYSSVNIEVNYITKLILAGLTKN